MRIYNINGDLRWYEEGKEPVGAVPYVKAEAKPADEPKTKARMKPANKAKTAEANK